MLRLTLNEDLARILLLFMKDSWNQQNFPEGTCPDLPAHAAWSLGALLSLNAWFRPRELGSPLGLCVILESGTVFPLASVGFGPGWWDQLPRRPAVLFWGNPQIPQAMGQG